MKSQTLGKSTSKVEILNIDLYGWWLYAKGKEYFLPHDEFPWFKEAKIADILNVELLHDFHLFWPSLDVDLNLNSLEDLSKTPLISIQGLFVRFPVHRRVGISSRSEGLRRYEAAFPVVPDHVQGPDQGVHTPLKLGIVIGAGSAHRSGNHQHIPGSGGLILDMRENFRDQSHRQSQHGSA